MAQSPQPSPPDDNPLTMPVERLRQEVAEKVMGWQEGPYADIWYPSDGTFGHYKVGWQPDINPVHTQKVKDKMRERGFRYGIGYNKQPPKHWAWFDKHDSFSDVPLVNDDLEGIAVCRAALLALK